MTSLTQDQATFLNSVDLVVPDGLELPHLAVHEPLDGPAGRLLGLVGLGQFESGGLNALPVRVDRLRRENYENALDMLSTLRILTSCSCLDSLFHHGSIQGLRKW